MDFQGLWGGGGGGGGGGGVADAPITPPGYGPECSLFLNFVLSDLSGLGVLLAYRTCGVHKGKV